MSDSTVRPEAVEGPDASTTIDVGSLNVSVTLHGVGIYPGDPTHRWLTDGFAKAVLTPEGAGAVRLTWSAERPVGTVEVAAWGVGADWLLRQVPLWLGVDDDDAGFDPTLHPKVHELWKRFGGFRMCTFGTIWQELLLVVIGQRVTSQDAVRSWSQLCSRWGTAAPGPDQLRLPPTPDVLGRLHYTDLHQIGIERRRADALLLAARRANRLEEAVKMNSADAVRRLSALPGFGTWTATATLSITHGDPDLVMLGDYGMPTLVNYFFTGDATRLPPEPDGDRVMLEHLEPWTGHRQRIMKLLMASDVRVPRRAPRAKNHDIRHR